MLQAAGVPESVWGDEALSQTRETERLAAFDEGVNAVLLASSLAEVDRLSQELADVSANMHRCGRQRRQAVKNCHVARLLVLPFCLLR